MKWNWRDHDIIVSRFLDPDLLKSRSKVQESRSPILHREMLLFLAKETAAICPIVGLDAWAGPSWNLAKLVLMANEQLGFAPAQMIPHENSLALLANMVTASEGSRFSSWRHKMVRTALMLTQLLEHNPKLLNQFDVASLFREVTGIPLRTYLSLILGVATKKLSEEKQTEMLPPPFQIDDQWFRETIVSQEELSAFLNDVSATPDQLTEAAKAASTHVSDFRCLAAAPLIHVSNQYIPVDFDLLIDKAYSGIFWRLLGALSDKKEQSRFIAFWGSVFEEYVNWVLENSVRDPINRFIKDPKYSDDPNAQVCDAIIVSGSTACFLEYKGSMFKADAKYSGDPWKLKSEIDLKLVGDAENRKGLLQLSKAISDVCGPDARKVEGLDLSGITKIYPVLVVRDEIALTFCFNQYLAFRFKRVCPRQKGKTITPLFVLGIDDLERVANYLDVTPLRAILDARWKADRNLVAPFFSVPISVTPDAVRRPPKVILQGLDLVYSMTHKVMFGRDS